MRPLRVLYCASTLKKAALSGTVKMNSSLPVPLIVVCGAVMGKGVKLLGASVVLFSTPSVSLN